MGECTNRIRRRFRIELLDVVTVATLVAAVDFDAWHQAIAGGLFVGCIHHIARKEARRG